MDARNLLSSFVSSLFISATWGPIAKLFKTLEDLHQHVVIASRIREIREAVCEATPRLVIPNDRYHDRSSDWCNALHRAVIFWRRAIGRERLSPSPEWARFECAHLCQSDQPRPSVLDASGCRPRPDRPTPICESHNRTAWPTWRSLVAHAWFLPRSEEHTSELQSRRDLVCRLLLEKKKQH